MFGENFLSNYIYIVSFVIFATFLLVNEHKTAPKKQAIIENNGNAKIISLILTPPNLQHHNASFRA